MRAPLFLLDPLPDAPTGGSVELSGPEGHHAATVRRLGIGEAVLLGDGRGGLLECQVAEVRAHGLLLSVLDRRMIAPPAPRLVVVQALPKGDRAEIAVEVLTELGVDEIVPWAAFRSITHWRAERGTRARQRWIDTARESAKQSRRAWVPRIAALADTAAVAARLAAARAAALVLDGDATTPLTAVSVDPWLASAEVVLVVGPEGGISPDEHAAFAAAGATPVRLGEPVLRTSTAGAAALAALSVRLGRWG